MVKGLSFILISEFDMMEASEMDYPKARVNKLITMVATMKDNLMMEKKKVKEFINGQMDRDMKAHSIMDSCMEEEY